MVMFKVVCGFETASITETTKVILPLSNNGLNYDYAMGITSSDNTDCKITSIKVYTDSAYTTEINYGGG